MSNEMCNHGYLPGMCPKGCNETANDSKETGLEHPPVRYNELPMEKLNCAICTMPVKEGRVYKGRAICKTCEDGLKGEARPPIKLPQIPSEEDLKKFPQQEQG